MFLQRHFLFVRLRLKKNSFHPTILAFYNISTIFLKVNNSILIIDFGSQVTQLIARRIREFHVFCEIKNPGISFDEIKKINPRGIILSGGPSSVYEKNAPTIDKKIFDLGIPILGICYGQQLICHLLGGKVGAASDREFGKAMIEIDDLKLPLLFLGIEPSSQTKHQIKPIGRSFGKKEEDGKIMQYSTIYSQVWMSHGDKVEKIPAGFEVIAKSPNAPFAAIADEKRKIYGVQFHPEVVHSLDGATMLRNFVINIAKCQPDWDMGNFRKDEILAIKKTVGKKQVICGLSGGVDSSVVAALINQAIGKQLTCIFVNHGLLRQGEAEEVQKVFGKHFKINLVYVDAEKLFLSKLKGISDPEKKRKIIGKTFIEVFDKESAKIKDAEFLALSNPRKRLQVP